jgi:mono/diheme cytochrome c family protein
MITSGEELYQGLCAICHGGPDAAPTAIGQGLNPPAPPLNNEPAKWTAVQVFWIVKNGIKMTGMPSFGNSHDSSDLWDIVAYIMKMPSLSSEKTHASDAPALSVDSATKAVSMSDKGIGRIKMVSLGPVDPKLASTGLKIFNRSCISCHLLDAPITGPALRSEISSRSPEFIMNMLVNTNEMVRKDSIVKETMSRFGNLKMPATGLDSSKARAVLEFLRFLAEEKK